MKKFTLNTVNEWKIIHDYNRFLRGWTVTDRRLISLHSLTYACIYFLTCYYIAGNLACLC